VFSVCVAAVKSRPVLHHCVVIFFWSSVTMECTCILFTFDNGVLLMRLGASVVLHHSLLLMNSFNKTEAAIFSCRLCFLRAFPFISLIGTVTDLHWGFHRVLSFSKPHTFSKFIGEENEMHLLSLREGIFYINIILRTIYFMITTASSSL